MTDCARGQAALKASAGLLEGTECGARAAN
jgi:hypothetical protein